MAAANPRRSATILFVAGLVIFLIALFVGLVFFNNTIGLFADAVTSVSFFTWTMIFTVLLVLVLVGLLMLFFTSGSAAQPTSLLHVTCAACGSDFDVTDPGVRPVAYSCPTCGTPGQVGGEAFTPEPEAEVVATDTEPPAPVLPPPATMEAAVEALLVRCTNCSHEFEIPYSTERPLHSVCPQCGEETVLEEGEDVLEVGRHSTPHGPEGGEPIVELEGIGNVYTEKLGRAGIVTTEQLRAADAARLARETGIQVGTIRTWQAMSDLIRVKGVGKQFAELLAKAGVKSVDELAAESPAHLSARLETYLRGLRQSPVKAGVDEKRARRWITAARKMAV